MIEVRGLTKRYGATLAVDDLTFAVRPGLVTGFSAPTVRARRTSGNDTSSGLWKSGSVQQAQELIHS
jgi:ABC-type branched-subunit amino acid transport system ATPase component